MTDLTLGIILKADGSGFVGEVKLGQDALGKLGREGKRAGQEGTKGVDALSGALGRLKGFVLSAIGAYAGFSTVQRLIGGAAREIMAAEKATANLNAVLRATGGTVGLTIEELSAFADRLEGTTLFDDNEIKQAEAVMLTFRQVQGDTFREAIGLATDLAALMGGDLQGAVLQLGKALEDPETGLTALRRSGISFTAEQRKLIKSLMETGDRAQAMQIILDTVAGQIGGVAAEQVTGLTGAFNELDDAWGDFQKSLADSRAFDVAIGGLKTLTEWAKRFPRDAGALEEVEAQIKSLQLERKRLFQDIADANESFLVDWFGKALGVGSDQMAGRIMEINDQISALQDAAKFLRAAGQIGTMPQPKGKIVPVGGDAGPEEESAEAKKIRETIEALEFEEEQLGRTSDEQALYNALHQAGVDIDSQAGRTIEQLVDSIQYKTVALELTGAAQEAGNDIMQEGLALTEALRTPTEIYADTVERLGELLASGAINQETFNRAIDLADETLEKAAESTDEWAEGWRNVGAISTEALADILVEAKNVGDVLDGLWRQILQIASQQLFVKPVNDLLTGFLVDFGGSLLNGAFPGAGSLLGGLFGGGGIWNNRRNVFGAKGLAFDHGRLTFMAKGGLLDGPTVFPMARGLAIGGEAGTEAVMPLDRDSSGRLGVRATGAGGNDVQVNIYNQSGQPAQARQRQAGDGRTVIDVVIGELTRDVANRGPMAQQLEGTYGLSRRGAAR